MILISLVFLLVLLGLSIPVGVALGLLGLSLDQIYSVMPLHLAVAEISWDASTNILLVAIPLFVMLGEILLRSGIADELYQGTAHWLSWLPGGLMHANVGTSMAFAATSGSSTATAATIGTIAIPLVDRYGYNERLFLGSLAAGGTLGILIPPSINMIIYGWLTDTSVPDLYLAGILPGIILAGLFGIAIIVCCAIRPAWGGRRIETSWRQRFSLLPALLPPLVIFIVVIGSIYAGWATPTESAALGVGCALLLAAKRRRLTLRMLHEVLEGTMRTTAMIALLLCGAWFLNFALTTLGVTDTINQFMTTYAVTPSGTLMTVIILYLIMGCFMESMVLMIVTVPVVTPVVVAAGYDPVWFGILIVLLIETAMITPPFGINLFIVQGVRRRGGINDIIIGVVPFVFSLLAMITVLIYFPQIALWLPHFAS